MAIREHTYTADLGGATRQATTVRGQPLNEISVPSTTGGDPAVWKVVDVTNWPTVRYETDTLPAMVAADLANAGVTKPKISHGSGHVPDFIVPDVTIPEMSEADTSELSADGIPDETPLAAPPESNAEPGSPHA